MFLLLQIPQGVIMKSEADNKIETIGVFSQKFWTMYGAFLNFYVKIPGLLENLQFIKKWWKKSLFSQNTLMIEGL